LGKGKQERKGEKQLVGSVDGKARIWNPFSFPHNGSSFFSSPYLLKLLYKKKFNSGNEL
jgi:hypothetical protein